jgi:uncharacterized OsmC-like protein
VEKGDDGVLIIKRIHVEHQVRAPEDQRGTVERVHGIYANRCPLYRSVKDAIAVSTSLKFVPE